MSYPHQPGSLHFDGAAAYEAYLDEATGSVPDSYRDGWKPERELDMTESERIAELEDALQRIAQWVEAYPLDIFPEPDWKRARKLLEAGGMTLDSVSAGAMRRVVTGMKAILASVSRDA